MFHLYSPPRILWMIVRSEAGMVKKFWILQGRRRISGGFSLDFDRKASGDANVRSREIWTGSSNGRSWPAAA